MGSSVNTLFGSFGPKRKHPLRPDDNKQLNESVWELHTTSEMPNVDIVFFHGLQIADTKEAFWRTWLSRDKTVIWPAVWLGDHLETKLQIQARILTISYDSYAQKHVGGMDLRTIVERLSHDLISDARVGQTCPVVLVGHSLGGIVIKQLVVHCNEVTEGMSPSIGRAKIENFVRNFKGVFYYSTPHHGSRVADNVTDFLDRIPVGILNDPLVRLLNTLNLDTARINQSFAQTRRKLKIRSAAIGESLPSKIYRVFSDVVVPEASARVDIDAADYYTAVADHFDVCKPTKRTDAIFQNLVLFITSIVEVSLGQAEANEVDRGTAR